MKRLISSLTLILLTLTPSSVKSQEEQGCFMLDDQGKRINLGILCDEEQTNTNSVHQIPIKRRESGIPVIDVRFNQLYTFEMLVDTGASATVLTPKMAQTLGIRPEGLVMVETAGGVIQSAIGRVNSVQAGNTTINNLAVIISPALSLGLLGQNFLGQYDVIIRQNVIEFHSR
jgi:aspartyl protease family protein